AIGYRSSDPEVENSHVAADVGVIHLIDDSDRITDPEFMESMANLGLTNRRRRVRATIDDDGEEVVQLNEVSYINHSGQDVINKKGCPQLNDEEVGNLEVQVPDADGDDEMERSDSDSEDSDFELNTRMESPLSSYRGSSQSDHLDDDKIDGEEVTSVEMQPYFDPNCDHKSIIFKEGLKFINPA
ncbi:hypothetical protein LINPERPRIM_LOCUS24832, partial [Linum perenne]